MTATNSDIRQEVYDALPTKGVNRYKYPPLQLNVPAVVVAGLDITPESMDDNRTVIAQLIVAIAQVDDQLEFLDRLLDPDDEVSVLQAIDDHVSDNVSLTWTSAGSYGDISWNGVAYFGAIVTVEALV